MSRRTRLAPNARGIIAVIAAGVAAGLALQVAGLRPVRVLSGSMLPAIEPGDWVVVGPPGRVRRGDVVLFRYPPGSTGRAIKRVAAIGGDVVATGEGRLRVNGRGVASAPPDARHELRVAAGDVFLVGDAPSSIDSRSFGPVPMADVVGRVRLVVAPRVGAAAAAATFALCVVGLATAHTRRRRPGSVLGP